MEEDVFGSGAGLCATGTQTRAPPEAGIFPPQYSNILTFHYSM
jgi:hypothetical protein